VSASTLEDRPVELQAKVAFLSRAESYPEGTSGVEVVETHMSFVFLTDRHAYKLKKPVRYEFLDFSTLAARRADCLEELRLNRRLARDVYLDVVPLTCSPAGSLRLGGVGDTVEFLVKMRRLRREQMLDHAIGAQRVSREEVQRFMRVLDDFYRATAPVAMDSGVYRQRFERDIRANRRELLDPGYQLSPALVEAVTAGQLAILEREAASLEQRAAAGRIVEGHGDLRPEHIFLGAEPVFIDCLEFNRDWRLLDPADEIAYLALECEYAGAPWIGEAALEAYREDTGDDPPSALVRFYKSCRATLRAKLSAWHLKDHVDPADRTKWIARAQRYLELAARYASTS
jgi:aminoglycoside phosphotransferase family enzyme